MHDIYLIDPGSRPWVVRLAEQLWGMECNFDSEGDGMAGDWTELTLALRSDEDQRVHVFAVDEHTPLILQISSEDAALATKTAQFIKAEAGGTLSDDLPVGRGD